MNYAAVLGRNPALSVAELNAVGTPQGVVIERVVGGIAFLSGDASTFVDRLGGITKLVKLIGTAEKAELAVSQAAGQAPADKKLSFGLSVYGNAAAGPLSILMKKYLRKRGISSRFVPTKDALSTAQVKHNALIGKGIEWCLIEIDGTWHYGETAWIQDFEGFAQRDYKKPVNDTKRGMLPPKLARMMVNLGLGDKSTGLVYDPFCGSGVVLMEATSMGFQVAGSDISKKAVTDTLQNLDWLAGLETRGTWEIQTADSVDRLPFSGVDAIVTEGYLGTAATAAMDDTGMLEQAKEVEPIMERFLVQAANALKPGARLILTLPMWKLRNGLHRLSLIDRVSSLGYTKLSPLPEGVNLSGITDRQTIEVSRPQQRVLHELVILQRT